MRRVTIVGGTGAGKSTLALALGQVLGLEVVHLDLVFLTNERTETARTARDTALSEVLERPAFLLEGGYRWTFARRIARCDTVIWLDIPPHRRLANMMRRKWSRGVPLGQHPDPSEARRKVAKLQSPVRLVWDQWRDAALLEPVVRNPRPGLRVIRLRSRTAAQEFLDSLRK
jgi:adenylate kinase family enzyme